MPRKVIAKTQESDSTSVKSLGQTSKRTRSASVVESGSGDTVVLRKSTRIKCAKDVAATEDVKSDKADPVKVVEKPVSKKEKTATSKSKDPEPDNAKVDPAPEVKKPVKGKGKKAATSKSIEAEPEDDVDDEEDLKPNKDLKGKGRALSPTQQEPEQDEPQVQEQHTERIVTHIQKGSAAVDCECPSANQFHIYESPDSTVWDTMLNQTNISANNNKFYLIQLLEQDSKNGYAVWKRWGRVGAHGQTDLSQYGAVEGAIRDFETKFRDKTKNSWSGRESFKFVPGKYDMLEKDYALVPEDKSKKSLVTTKETPMPDSTLKLPVQDLIRLIFDVKMMSQFMMEIGYDANKLPLGKLTKNHVKRGYDVLCEISAVLQSATPDSRMLNELTSRFYTIIPHNFKRNRPPVIDSARSLKTKLEMIESLGDIQIATKLMDHQPVESNPIDHHFSSLNNRLEHLPRDHEMFNIIQEYSQNTHAGTHSSYTLEINDVFECYRDVEHKNFTSELNNRMLLWHGSRLTNYAGILSQGLRIAPPEAPVTGYMFGKGVYFADMVSKSANYCNTSRASSTGLLLLCEVALGDVLELKQSDYHADQAAKRENKNSTKGCGRTVPDEKQFKVLEDGVVVPMGKPSSSSKSGGTLLYNEYIVYDTDQIKLRYLIRATFKYRY